MKRVILLAGTALMNFSLFAEPIKLTELEQKEFLTQIARLSVFDYGINASKREEMIVQVLGQEYAELAVAIDESGKYSATAMVAAFGAYSDKLTTEKAKVMVAELLEISPNKYTRKREKTKPHPQSVIELSDKCSIQNHPMLPTAAVIDLRSNGGGSLSCAIKVANKLISNDEIEAVIIDNLAKTTVRLRNNEPVTSERKRVVYVDSKTASAAEFLAFVLKQDGWDVRFEKGSVATFGKNSVMIEQNLWGLKYTVETGHFFVGECEEFACKLKKKEASE